MEAWCHPRLSIHFISVERYDTAHASYLLRLVNQVLHYSLHSVKFSTHLRTRANRCDGFVERRFLVRIRQEAISNRPRSFLFPCLLELNVDS